MYARNNGVEEMEKPYRKPAGPKVKIKDRRYKNVSLGEAHIKKAREIGRGNVSEGIRVALDRMNAG